MKYDWALWKAKVNDDVVRFLHVDDLPASGFASVYCFSEADARSMDILGTYKSFKGTVHSPTLKLDCDSAETSDSTEKRLRAMEVGFTKFSTGNRGNHFAVERNVSPSHVLPTLDRSYVARQFPGADVSFYHHVGWYRQEGATHPKTGEKKVLLGHVVGKALDFTGVVLQSGQETGQETTRMRREGEPQSVFADKYLSRISVPYSGGERHNRLCAVAAQLDNLHQPMEWAFGYLANVNLMCDPPLPEEELMRILTWAYEQRDKS